MIDIYGVENSMSPLFDLCTKLTYLGLQCRFNADAYLQQIGAGHLTKDDTAIAFSHSGSSADTVKALKLAEIRRRAHHRCHQQHRHPAGQLWLTPTLLAGRGDMAIYGNAIFSRVAHSITVDMLYMSVILSDYGRFSTELDRSGRIIADRGFCG